MKVGDLVFCEGYLEGFPHRETGIVIGVREAAPTIKVFWWKTKKINWWPLLDLKVLSEGG